MFVTVVYFKMTMQRDNRVKDFALLRAGHKVSDVAKLVGVSCRSVYAIKKRKDDDEGVDRRAGSGCKTVANCDSLLDAIQSIPRTFLRQHARRFGVGSVTVRRTVAKLGAKSPVVVERSLLTSTIRVKRLERYQMLVNDLKPAPA